MSDQRLAQDFPGPYLDPYSGTHGHRRGRLAGLLLSERRFRPDRLHGRSPARSRRRLSRADRPDGRRSVRRGSDRLPVLQRLGRNLRPGDQLPAAEFRHEPDRHGRGGRSGRDRFLSAEGRGRRTGNRRRGQRRIVHHY